MTAVMTAALPADLQALLDEAKDKVQDTAKIWVRTSRTYDSKLSIRKGLVLGGSTSPFFVAKRKTEDDLLAGNYVAGGTSCVEARVFFMDRLYAESVEASLESWVPMLESIAKANESLVIACPSFESQPIAAMLVVNNHRGTLRCAIINPGPITQAKIAKLQEKPGAQIISTNPRAKDFNFNKESLILLEDVWIRRDASVGFFSPKSAKPYEEILDEVAVIEVGGKSYEDLFERFQLFSQAIVDW